MCYNLRAVESTVKRVKVSAQPGSAQVDRSNLSQGVVPGEDASRYCPVCSQRLESRRCKLICNVCGYYMSCADYY